MINVTGKYSSAVIYSDDAEEYAIAQVKMICDQEASKDCKITCMPDIHPGKIGPIGLSMTINNRIIPGLLGNDIGCGMLCIPILSTKKIEFDKLDNIIKENCIHRSVDDFDSKDIPDWNKGISHVESFIGKYVTWNDAKASYCTLGGGNHFIEIDKDANENKYLVIHSGSRSFGAKVSKYYMDLAHKLHSEVSYELSYIDVLDGSVWGNFGNDVMYTEVYAKSNRLSIAKMLDRKMKLKLDYDNAIDCPHNYLDIIDDNYQMILHKGSISAEKDKDVIIPINMRDGVILGKGKGNRDWNYSAPHGSGRLFSRTEVSNHYTVSQFKKEMKGIHAIIDKTTLDECPMTYRNIDIIKKAIDPAVEITKILKPIYNFKSGD